MLSNRLTVTFKLQTGLCLHPQLFLSDLFLVVFLYCSH